MLSLLIGFFLLVGRTIVGFACRMKSPCSTAGSYVSDVILLTSISPSAFLIPKSHSLCSVCFLKASDTLFPSKKPSTKRATSFYFLEQLIGVKLGFLEILTIVPFLFFNLLLLFYYIWISEIGGSSGI